MTTRRSTTRFRTAIATSVLTGALALTLTACGQSGEAKSGATPSIAAASGSEATQNKFGEYTEGFNKLIDDHWGVSEKYEAYVKANIPGANASGNVYFPENISNLERALDSIRKGRALNGGDQSREADAAADQVLAQGGALLAQWKELGPYYESKAYRDDNLAKGKAAHAALIAAYEGTLSSIDEFDVALTKHLRTRREAEIAAFKKAGKTDAYNVYNAMYQADLLSSAVIEKNTAEAERVFPLLVAANAELHKTEAATATGEPNKVEYDLISGYLDRMIGDYRDLKQSNSDSDRKDIVDGYNRAINQLNDVEFER